MLFRPCRGTATCSMMIWELVAETAMTIWEVVAETAMTIWEAVVKTAIYMMTIATQCLNRLKMRLRTNRTYNIQCVIN